MARFCSAITAWAAGIACVVAIIESLRLLHMPREQLFLFAGRMPGGPTSEYAKAAALVGIAAAVFFVGAIIGLVWLAGVVRRKPDGTTSSRE